ncbi:uncharacterized protein si:dkey-245n4.2 isoform X1 [Chiloscyllium plagiosum]|uniref:uncharacterized protein si:dkey-245n4.2 isoform X1 n=1 Tax=Chiloscyllium plagiosum TaxID=36176 RepID=UPI001CB85498|nr:uncharacterized protein si:dkey-245n4.2 isoform X1 [Chiloscyllium plagiosum]XP_043543441.1 uncharacterized protein si:dkey-245n4.2 isoform X1 [Chiloscyllium plagiosum]
MKSVIMVLYLFYLFQIERFEGFNIKNMHLDKCIRANNEKNRISLTECNPDSEQQQWRWDSHLNSIVSLKTEQCLTVHKANKFGTVKLEPCASGQLQAWICSKRGHLTLEGFSLHLSIKHGTNKVHISHEKGKLSKWRTLKDQIICKEANNHIWQHEGHHIEVSETQTENIEKSTYIPMINNVSNASYPTFENITHLKENDKTVRFKLSDDTTWKVTMLILGAIMLMLGLIILPLNVLYHNQKKKSHAGIVADSADEKTSLTTGLKLQHDASRSPSLRHGEILIEWKDGKITPLFDDN